MFIVFDLDGTLANCDHRAHYLQQKPKDWEAYFNACDKDKPYSEMLALMSNLQLMRDINGKELHRIEIWTGRREDQREKTKKWLYDHSSFFTPKSITLMMRPNGVITHDLELKGKWLEERGTPDIIFEDRNSMVEFWRSKGIRCCQVQIGDF